MQNVFKLHVKSPMLVLPEYVPKPDELRLVIRQGDIDVELTFSEEALKLVVAALTERTPHRGKKIPMKED